MLSIFDFPLRLRREVCVPGALWCSPSLPGFPTYTYTKSIHGIFGNNFAFATRFLLISDKLSSLTSAHTLPRKKKTTLLFSIDLIALI